MAVDCCNTVIAVAFIWEKALLQESKQFQHVEIDVSLNGVFCRKGQVLQHSHLGKSTPCVHFHSVIHTQEFHAFLLLRFSSFDDKFCHSCDMELCGMYSSQMITVSFNIKYTYSSSFGRSQYILCVMSFA
jgi:hypothetical protein